MSRFLFHFVAAGFFLVNNDIQLKRTRT